MSTKSRKSLSNAVIVSLAVVLFFVGPVLAAESDIQAPVSYPHAGISIALPEGFNANFAADPSVVMRAGKLSFGKPAVAVTVSAFCVGPKATAKEFADFSDNALKSQLSVRKFKALKSVPIKVAGIQGEARLLKYTYDGVMTTAARVFFIRQFEGKDLVICYVLNVEVGEKHESKLLTTLNQVINGVKLIELQAPASIATRLSRHKLTDYRAGFSLTLPEAWYGSPVRGGLSMGQKNYLVGGADSPQVVVLATAVDSDATSETMARKAASRYLAATTQPDSGIELVSKGPAKIGKQDAYQYVLKLTYKVAPSTNPADDKAQPVKIGKIQAVRVVCRTDSDGKTTHAYFFTLSCLEGDAKQVTPWLDAIGQGLEYIPLPKPASKPVKSK